MININDLRISFETRVNYIRQGSIRPSQLNQIADDASLGEFRKLLGLSEQIDPRTGTPPMAYPRTKVIHADLTPFKVWKDVPVTSNILLASELPQDIAFVSAVQTIYYVEASDVRSRRSIERCGCDQKPSDKPQYLKLVGDVREIPEDKWARRFSSVICLDNIYCPYSTDWQFKFREQPQFVRISYLKIPKAPVWGYTQNPDESLVYNPATSTDLEWNKMQMFNIVTRMHNIYAANKGDQTGIAVSQQKIRSGE